MVHTLRENATHFPSQGSSVEITELGLSDMEAAHPAQSDQASLPAFGTGIEFRPKQKPEAAVQPTAASAPHAPGGSSDVPSGTAGGGALGSHLQSDEEALQEDGHAMDLGSPTAVPPAAAALPQAEGVPVVPPHRQRNYRKAVAQ